MPVCRDFGPIKVNEMGKMLAVMTKFRNVCAHNDRLYDFHTKDAILDRGIHERLQPEKRQGRYVYGKNDLFALLISLKLLLSEDEFKALFHNLKLSTMPSPRRTMVSFSMAPMSPALISMWLFCGAA